MANVAVKASFLLNTGEVVDMNTTMAEGTASELQTSTTYAVSAVSIGTYAEGKMITQILQPPSAPNGIAYAYVNRRGEILCVLPVAVEGVQSAPCPMPFGWRQSSMKYCRVRFCRRLVRVPPAPPISALCTA